jgi:hypothetical protein
MRLYFRGGANSNNDFNLFRAKNDGPIIDTRITIQTSYPYEVRTYTRRVLSVAPA